MKLFFLLVLVIVSRVTGNLFDDDRYLIDGDVTDGDVLYNRAESPANYDALRAAFSAVEIADLASDAADAASLATQDIVDVAESMETPDGTHFYLDNSLRRWLQAYKSFK